MMTGTMFDIEKFSRKNDFALWQVRIKALLEQQGLAAALKELPAVTIAAYDNVIQKQTFYALILCKSQSEHIDEFYKLVGDLAVFGSGADEYANVDVMVAMIINELLDWILDSGDSYHMIYMRDYFFDFEVYDGDNILLGVGRECHIRRKGKVQIQMRNGSSCVLDNVSKIKVIKGLLVLLSGSRRANYVYTLDGYAVTRKTLKEVFTTMYEEWGRQTFGCCSDTTEKWVSSGDERDTLSKVNRSPSSAIGFKVPIDILRFFGWLASIKQWMLESVKVKCIFLGYHKGFNESREYKKTFIGSGVGTGSMQMLQGVEFEEVQTQDLIYYHSARNREQHLAWELFKYREDFACKVISKWKAGLKDDMDAQSDVYVLSNGYRKCSDDSDGYYWEYTPGLLDKAKGNILGMEIIRDQSGNTLRVTQSRFYNGKLSILSLEGSLSGDYDVEKNGKWSCIYAVGSQEYQVICTRLDISSADVALSPTEAGYMTLTDPVKEAICINGLLTESRAKLMSAAIFCYWCLVKGDPYSKVLAMVEVAVYHRRLI
ncbi:hypothetical protein Tco_0389424 [Tanacetum coccineum]